MDIDEESPHVTPEHQDETQQMMGVIMYVVLHSVMLLVMLFSSDYFSYLFRERNYPQLFFISNLYFWSVYLYFRVADSDPGFLSPDRHQIDLEAGPDSATHRHCGICHADFPVRSKHCHHCGRCVATFDHHCDFLSNCIGERNHALFLLFLLCQTALTITFIAFGIKAAPDRLSDQSFEDYFGKNFNLLMGIVAAMVFLPFVGILVGIHTVLILSGTTTYEFVKPEKIPYLDESRYEPRPFGGSCFTHLVSAVLAETHWAPRGPRHWEPRPLGGGPAPGRWSWVLNNAYYSCC